MPSYRWLWEHRGSLPSNTVQETSSTCGVACGKCSHFHWFLVLGGVRWSTRTSLQFSPLGLGIQRLGATIILDTPFPALNILLGAHLTFNVEDRKKTTLVVLRRMEHGDSQATRFYRVHVSACLLHTNHWRELICAPTWKDSTEQRI